ncbi:unnamed protein product [Symbiodinium pilosum]|uniref:Uncharacterized protein n=1 Tax=Symbiodinium pilosum TaxID=2952 RepID=A0A812T2R5_SYMPI|nr:unnamed protein product [Symbiodinium pilosum]
MASGSSRHFRKPRVLGRICKAACSFSRRQLLRNQTRRKRSHAYPPRSVKAHGLLVGWTPSRRNWRSSSALAK